MTTKLAREIFRVECDKRSVGAYDTFIVSEIDYFLSFAIRQFYERRLSGFTKDRTSFEEWQKRSQDLRYVYSVFREDNPLNLVFRPRRGCMHLSIELPGEEDLWHVLSEECVFRNSSTGLNFSTDVYECTTDNLTSRINNSLGDHIFHANKLRPLRLFTFRASGADEEATSMFSDLYYIDTDNSVDDVMLSYTVEYIKKPESFGTQKQDYDESVDADKKITPVPDYAWDDVISIAVLHALENSGSPRVNTYSQEQQIIL